MVFTLNSDGERRRHGESVRKQSWLDDHEHLSHGRRGCRCSYGSLTGPETCRHSQKPSQSDVGEGWKRLNVRYKKAVLFFFFFVWIMSIILRMRTPLKNVLHLIHMCDVNRVARRPAARVWGRSRGVTFVATVFLNTRWQSANKFFNVSALFFFSAKSCLPVARLCFPGRRATASPIKMARPYPSVTTNKVQTFTISLVWIIMMLR